MIDKPAKPIRPRIVKSYGGFTRVPYSEPLTPGLRKTQPTNAIGFTAELLSLDSETDIDGSKK